MYDQPVQEQRVMQEAPIEVGRLEKPSRQYFLREHEINIRSLNPPTSIPILPPLIVSNSASLKSLGKLFLIIETNEVSSNQKFGGDVILMSSMLQRYIEYLIIPNISPMPKTN